MTTINTTEDGTMKDEDIINPEYLFAVTHKNLLCAIATGKIDAKKLAVKELQNRGLDERGKFTGFAS